MFGGDVDARDFADLFGEPFGDRYGAVFAAGAPDGEGRVALVLALVSGENGREGRGVGVDEFFRTILGEYVVADALIETGVRSQFWHPERVGEESSVGNGVGVGRNALFETEAHDRQLNAGSARFGEHIGDDVRQLVDVELGRVDDDIARFADGREP